MLIETLLRLLAFAAAQPLLQAGAIILGTFILEDAATVLAALRVADGGLSGPLALAALYIGIVLGDLGLYGMGRAAAHHPWARRYLDMKTLAQARGWASSRLIAIVMSARFLPGARLPTYTACGFLGVPLDRFAIGVVAATLIWTTLLFGAGIAFGDYVLVRLGSWRWAAGAGFVLAILLIGRLVARWRERAERLAHS
jgi:membrane protein DedA with SNARE-associated domain